MKNPAGLVSWKGQPAGYLQLPLQAGRRIFETTDCFGLHGDPYVGWCALETPLRIYLRFRSFVLRLSQYRVEREKSTLKALALQLFLCRRKTATSPAAPSNITAKTVEPTRYLGLEPRGYSEEEKDLVSRAHRKRGSRRAVSRMFGVSRNASGRWLEKRQLPQCLRKTQPTGKSESPVASWPAHKRFFGRLRQKLARQVRRTRAASQSERTGHLTTKLFVEWYNEAAT